MVFQKYKHSPLRMRGGGIVDAISTQSARVTGIVKPLMIDAFRLLPDSILFGSLFFAMISQSFAMGMFVVSMLEASLVAVALRKLMTYMDISRSLPSLSEDPSMCVPSTFSPSIEDLLMFNPNGIQSGFPSFPLYFLSVASSYVVGSVWSQKRELEALGPQYAARFYIAVAVTTVLLFTMAGYRLAYGCDGAGTLILTTLIGLVVGGLLLYQNIALMGRDAVNFSGIPLLRERTKDGKPLYVCTQKGVA